MFRGAIDKERDRERERERNKRREERKGARVFFIKPPITAYLFRLLYFPFSYNTT